MSTKAERKARRERYKNATPEQKSNYAKYQRENFKNIAASFPRAEAQTIAAEYTAHGITPAQVMLAAWHRLINGEDSGERIREDAEKARAEYAAMTAATTDEKQPPNA